MKGHRETDCWKKARNNNENENVNVAEDNMKIHAVGPVVVPQANKLNPGFLIG